MAKALDKGEEPITEEEYKIIKRGLDILVGGESLGRYGFYNRATKQHTARKYATQACYASLGDHWRDVHKKDILYVSFNRYNQQTGHHHPGKFKFDSPEAVKIETEWLNMCLSETGPFAEILPFLYHRTACDIMADGGMIFQNVSEVPSKLFAVFLICVRCCQEHSNDMDVFFHLRQEHSLKLSALIATGCRPVIKGDFGGRWELHSPPHTYISGDVSSFAYRFLCGVPKKDAERGPGRAYGTEGILSGRANNMYSPNCKRKFESKAEVIKHFLAERDAQKAKAA